MSIAGSGSRSLGRRTVLRSLAAGGAALAVPGLAAGCGKQADFSRDAARGAWRQFSGSTLNFITENTGPSAAIAANLKPFVELTGIEVNIVSLELGALVQKVALDLAAGSSQYHVIYADPYQVMAPYSRGLVDLRELVADESLPQPEQGLRDFVPTLLEATGTFGPDGAVYALPYDCPTMIWQYRADLFDKYRGRMEQDLGFDPSPSDESTWEQYLATARWLTDNADEVEFGTGHQAKQHDSLMCDFSNLLWSYGGDYFDGGDTVGSTGTADPGRCTLGEPAGVAAAVFYRTLVAAGDPGSRTWDWDGVGAAFRAGRIAMCPNWHEFAASNEEELPGKVGYAPLPTGPARRAHMFGGTGIGINGNTRPNERGAAWLFLVWATSADVQLSNLKSEQGATPTLSSVYALDEVRGAEQRPTTMPNILTAAAVRTAWEPENIGLRPKIPMWNECDTAIYTQLSRMVAGEATPAEAMAQAAERVDAIVDRGWVG